MKNLNPVAASGIAFLAVGLVLVLVLDPWVIGLVFLIIGGQRLFVGLQTRDSAQE